MAGAVTYAELHCHSNFTFLSGTSDPEDLVARAADLGLSALALTDSHGLYGIVRFAAAAEARIVCGEPSPLTIVGAELLLLEDGERIVLLVRDLVGYRNLCWLINRAHRTYGRDRVAMVCEVNTYRGRSAIRDVAVDAA